MPTLQAHRRWMARGSRRRLQPQTMGRLHTRTPTELVLIVARTKHRGVRIDDELWEATQECAAAEGTTAAEIIRDCLHRRVRKYIKSQRGARTDLKDKGQS